MSPRVPAQLGLRMLAAAGILLTLVCVVYLPYLGNSLVFDDFNLFDGNRIYDYAAELWRNQFRWISYATLAHVHMLTDGSIVANRVGNLLVHAGNVFAVYVLLRQLLEATQGAAGGVDERSQQVIALFAAAVFAVHPVAVYGVGYLVQRPIQLSTLFMLFMLIAWTRWLVGGRNLLWAWAVFWYACSVFSKEHSVAAPGVALLLAVTLQKPSLGLVRRIAMPMAAMAVVAIVISAMAKGVIGVAYEPEGATMLDDLGNSDLKPGQLAYPLSVITQMHLFFKYLFLWCFPDVGRMAMDMREPFASSFGQWPYWASAAAFVGYLLLAVYLALQRGRRGLVGWLLAYPWLMFMTELSTVRVQEPFVLYRAYLWFPLFSALLPIALLREGVRTTVITVSILLCILVPLSWNRLHSLSDPLIAWNDAARLIRPDTNLGAPRIYYNRALALSAQGRKAEALADLDRVVAEKPGLASMRFARARVYFDLKQYPQALDDINVSIKIDSKRASAYFARAMTLKRLGRDAEAAADIDKSCALGDAIACFARAQRKPVQSP